MGATVARAQRRREQRRGSKGNHLPVFGLVALLVAALFVVAIVLGGDNRSSTRGRSGEPQQTAAVQVSGEPLGPLPDGADAAVGRPAPLASGESFEGSQVAITENGRPKAILFVAHWCPHCQVEVPKIQSWLNGGGDTRGVDLVTVSTAVDEGQPNYPPSAWLEREGWTAPVMVDDAGGSVADAFGVSGYPFFVFLDREGRVTARASGEIAIEQFEAFLAQAAGI